MAAVLACPSLPSSLCNFSSRIHMFAKEAVALFISALVNTSLEIAVKRY